MSDDQPRLGKYEIIRTLGHGAMGVVYEGIDRVIDRRVAIKTVRTTDLDADEAEEHLRRFLIEARAAGKLNHPNIVSLYDHGEHEGTAFLVMELVLGRELQQWFDDGRRFASAETLRLMAELLDALGYSHQHGVVHRDVKPANIFITESGRLKLGDFGIARIESAQKTRAGLAIGTPTHMAPEQIRGETADARADLYAAGVVLFQLLTGSRPFTGTMLSMALKVLNEPAPLPSSVDPQVTPALDAVVAKALAKAPDQRYQSAEDFRQALQQAIQQQTVPLRSPSIVTDAGSRSPTTGDAGVVAAARPSGGAATASDPAGLAMPATEPLRRADAGNRLPIWLAAGGALAALLGAVWWLQSGRPSAPPPPVTIEHEPAPERAPDSRPSSAAPPSAPAARSKTPAPPAADKPSANLDRPVDRPTAAASAAAPAAPLAPAPTRAPAPAEPAIVARPSPVPPPVVARPAAEPAATRQTASQRDDRNQAPRADTAPKPAPIEAATAPPAAARERLPAKCSDILLKASLEPLTTEESRYLRRECQ